jgi:hypothetical protein
VRASKDKAAEPGFLQQEYSGTGPTEAVKAQLLTGEDTETTLHLEMPGSQYWVVGKLTLKLEMAIGALESSKGAPPYWRWVDP